ncbi:MAG: CRISPR-associated endonuclease Cas2 [Candidatus Micrarchaeota archaeon]|nr:CRISPR-associated endonuclease Cas2 [Candidatus Micrarchaeota archaeon]
MFYWIIYDISDNKRRDRVARICKNYGFRRVQKSAFAGETTQNRLEMLELECKEVLESGQDGDCLFVLPACSSCFNSKRITMGSIDERKIRDCGYMFAGGSV